MRTRAAWIIAVITASLAWSAPAGAASVEGSLRVTDVTPTTVSFTATTQRNGCVSVLQCDYFSEIDQIDGDGACPADHPYDPWIAWTGDVQNTGPTAETATITPRRWTAKGEVPPSQLCLYMFVDGTYSLIAGATITRPAAPVDDPATPGSPPLPGSKPKAPGTSGSSPPAPDESSPTLTCAPYVYQQNAQKALDRNDALAVRLDRNGNGVACQGLPKRKTYVRTLGVAASATSVRAALRRAYGKAFAQRTRYRSRCARLSRIRVRCAVSWQHKGTWKGYVDVVGTIRDNQQAVVAHVAVRRP